MSFATLSIEQLRQRHGNKWQQFGAEVLAAWVADMDFPLAGPIHRCLEEYLRRDDFGYPLHADQDPLPAVFAERMRQRYAWSPREDLIAITSDVVQALYVALECFSEAGAGVVLQTPIYHPFLGLVRDLKRHLVANPLRYTEASWQIDFEQLASGIDERTRVLLFCNPHNPSGRVWTREELEAVAEVALRHNLLIFSDEIHSDLTYPGHQHIPMASLSPQVEARTITFNSATKAFNIAGLRCALAVFGSEELKKRFDAYPKRLLGGLGSGVSEITRVAWTECGDWHAQLMDYLAGNRRLIGEFLAAELPTVQYREPQSTYLAWLDFKATGLAEDPHSFFLREARVALSPGPQFGDPGVGCARLNFATDREILREILQRLRDALAAHN